MSFSVLHCASAGFESACRIPSLPPHHRSHRLHGHSYFATVRAALPPAWAAFAGGEVEGLRNRMGTCVAPLDHAMLNDHLTEPTDENLARWVRAHLAGDVPGIRQVGVQSTLHSGVDLDAAGQAHVWRRYRFQAAHRLPHVPLGHQCGRMHGHGFEVILHANVDMRTGPVERDIALDYDQLDAIWAPFHAVLNYRCLNEIEGLSNPTSEHISAWLWARVKPVLPELSWVTVYETGSCGANFNGSSYRIWKDMTMDSAVRLKQAPQGHPLAGIHGHTFTLRLHLAAPLDQVMGWTVDFGDVKALFNPLFKALDHHPLYEIASLPDGDAATLAAWVLEHGGAVLPALDRVDLYETRGSGAIVSRADSEALIPV